jgi:1,4-dihydroxy-2-naphthoyl-CoA synthase
VATPDSSPRPPDGDWLGTPYLIFERQGPIAVCTIDRPEARNALTPAMYFGIRYAVGRVNEDPDLAGLLITGTGDVFKSSIDSYFGLYDRIGMTASLSDAEARDGFRAFKERRSPDWVHPERRAEGRL